MEGRVEEEREPVPPSVTAGVVGSEQARRERLEEAMRRLAPLELPIPRPGPEDWMAVHSEPAQTWDAYLAAQPTSALGVRRTIVIQPLGDFSPVQWRIVEETAGFLGHFFVLPVRIRGREPLSKIPENAQRRHPAWGDNQLLTTWILHSWLQRELPDDAAALICLTTSDLYPADDWNFVFGQADIRARVAVWSMYRNGFPEVSHDSYLLCLRRTAKTAAHELAHVFSIRHETDFLCLLNGSNHRAEADRRPLWLCPRSMAKLCWATGADPLERMRGLEVFCREHGLKPEAAYYHRAIELLAQ
jgi:archaemetzincin